MSVPQVTGPIRPTLPQTVTAGTVPQFSPQNGTINLEQARYANMDPVEALKTEFKERTGLEFNDQLKGFALHKGFRPPEQHDKSLPIELHSFQNEGGPECYSLTRYWSVSYNDANGQPQIVHFKREIYTSVQIPLGLEGHKQKQYIAALAARTYSNVVESMIKKQAGETDALYNQLGDHLSKVAKDRFVTMEMYDKGAHRVTINPERSSFVRSMEGIEDQLVTTVQLNIRSGNKRSNKKKDVPGEAEADAYPQIKLTDKAAKREVFRSRAHEFQANLYRYHSNPHSSTGAQQLSFLSRKEEIFDLIDNQRLTPEQACENVGLNPMQYRTYNQDHLDRTSQKFADHLHLFKDKKQLLTLMQDYGSRGADNTARTINDQTKELLPPKEKTGFRKVFSRNEPPKEFALLTAIVEISNNPQTQYTRIQKEDLDAILAAYDKAYEKMLTINEEIKTIEAGFKKMNIPLDETVARGRKEKLNALSHHINNAKRALSDARVLASQPPTSMRPPNRRPDSVELVSEED